MKRLVKLIMVAVLAVTMAIPLMGFTNPYTGLQNATVPQQAQGTNDPYVYVEGRLLRDGHTLTNTHTIHVFRKVRTLILNEEEFLIEDTSFEGVFNINNDNITRVGIDEILFSFSVPFSLAVDVGVDMDHILPSSTRAQDLIYYIGHLGAYGIDDVNHFQLGITLMFKPNQQIVLSSFNRLMYVGICFILSDTIGFMISRDIFTGKFPLPAGREITTIFTPEISSGSFIIPRQCGHELTKEKRM